MRQYHFLGSQNVTRPPITNNYVEGHALASNDFASWDKASGDANESTSSTSETYEHNIDNDDMFAEEAQLTVEDYIRGLSPEYNPKRVLEYLSWRKRVLSPLEREVVAFLRTISFGGGLSAAHTKEMLEYARGLGGTHTWIYVKIICPFVMPIYNVHFYSTLVMYIFMYIEYYL